MCFRSKLFLAVAENQPSNQKPRMTIIATTLPEFAAQMREFIREQDFRNLADSLRPNDEEFNQLALSLFALQFSHNTPYRNFCRARY